MKTFFKVISADRQLWYGTFKTRKEAVDRMKKDYPQDEHQIIEVK
jgi:hypothetical protein